eukprot:2786392-Pleurochrysis_carterae.AAC.1
MLPRGNEGTVMSKILLATPKSRSSLRNASLQSSQRKSPVSKEREDAMNQAGKQSAGRASKSPEWRERGPTRKRKRAVQKLVHVAEPARGH